MDIKIANKTYRCIFLEDGDAYKADDVNARDMTRAKSIKNRVEQEQYPLSEWMFHEDGKANGWGSNYLILREVKEPEYNEFGEVSP